MCGWIDRLKGKRGLILDIGRAASRQSTVAPRRRQVANTRIMSKTSLTGLEVLRDITQHLINRCDRLRAHLVGALRLDHRDKLGNHIDI